MQRGITRVQCKNCGEFFTGHVRNNYCSDSCKAEGEAWQKHFKAELAKRNKLPKQIECQACGTMFEAPTLKSKYCSEKCRRKVTRYANKMRAREVRKKEIEEDLQLQKESEWIRIKPKESLKDYNERARSMGITYGKLSEMEQAKSVRVIIPRKEVAHG